MTERIGALTGCNHCNKDFIWTKKDVKVRDLGEYPGEPHFEGRETYIICPHCGHEMRVTVFGELTSR